MKIIHAVVVVLNLAAAGPIVAQTDTSSTVPASPASHRPKFEVIWVGGRTHSSASTSLETLLHASAYNGAEPCFIYCYGRSGYAIDGFMETVEFRISAGSRLTFSALVGDGGLTHGYGFRASSDTSGQVLKTSHNLDMVAAVAQFWRGPFFVEAGPALITMVTKASTHVTTGLLASPDTEFVQKDRMVGAIAGAGWSHDLGKAGAWMLEARYQHRFSGSQHHDANIAGSTLDAFDTSVSHSVLAIGIGYAH